MSVGLDVSLSRFFFGGLAQVGCAKHVGRDHILPGIARVMPNPTLRGADITY
jgi:hypothetical protein